MKKGIYKHSFTVPEEWKSDYCIFGGIFRPVWLGKVPYRMWKNRLKGQNIGVWKSQYNDFAPVGMDILQPRLS